ncbi:MAG TPA: hypothetical protein VHI52_10695 [Verrucomicrobiae bacterium]|nr:hypothetical protein [Verrucomicrobiae bacterium]
MNRAPQSWSRSLLGLLATAVVAVLVVRWLWALTRPMLPVLIVAGIVVGIVYFLIRRHQRI